jgi:hypothetical protein
LSELVHGIGHSVWLEQIHGKELQQENETMYMDLTLVFQDFPSKCLSTIDHWDLGWARDYAKAVDNSPLLAFFSVV